MALDQNVTFSTIRIPKGTPHIESLAEQFKDFKLTALQASPEAFAAKFEDENLLPTAVWVKRLTTPGHQIFIALATHDAEEDDVTKLLKGSWIGMFTLIGPVPYDEFIWPESGAPLPGSDGTETRWQMTALYTNPDYRGKGIAKKLINTAIDFGQEYSQTLGPGVKTRFRLFVHPNNTVVLKMYEGMGFVDAGKVTLAEAFIAVGEADLIPKDPDPAVWHLRAGYGMEHSV
ncbi:hypothetical protein M501DRAFT_985165 [Patellaria atrata CBS 101060]|uniref:N-acetyltransferase domain-containing protein n=1 Tax=Patellaria atrata CBS 101060 TaxID=1346257 RepID=A0A9P4SI84_9PEZI|nr:hypothetical protein M501DRAFT_985165 [Patellaria atrata CBS 101060]